MWVVIVGVGGVFVFYLGFRGGFAPKSAASTVVGAGDVRFDGRDFERTRRGMEQRYREALGEQFDAEAARGFLVESAGSALLRSALLGWQGQQMGLTVSDEEIRAYLKDAGLTDAQGRLDRERITDYAEREFGSVRRFQERLRTDLLVEKTARLIWDSAAVSDGEARDAVRYQLEEAKVALVKLDGRHPSADLEVPEEASQALLQQDPERVRQSYEARRSEFDQPEQAHLRHLLIRVEPGDDAAKQEARTRIDALRARVLGGEDFAAVAKEASEDPATKESGGDLGFVSRGGLVAPLDGAAFSQEIGAVGEVLESPQGLHLLLVEERRPARVVPFEEAQAQVARDLARQDAAVAAARARAEALSKAITAGTSLVEAAREQGLEILRPDALRRNPSGYVPQLGIAPSVVAAAFTLDPAHPSDPTVHTLEDNVFVMVQLLERKSPSQTEIEQALAATRERILQQRRSAGEQAWLEQLRGEAGAQGELVYDLAAFR